MYASFLSIIKQLDLTEPCWTTIDLNFKFLFLCLINEFFFNLFNFKVAGYSFEKLSKQYEDLQELWDKYKSKGLIVLGVPSDSFNQEKKTNSEVKEFCEVNFEINFPLTTITKVKGRDAHEIFKWAENNFGKSAIPKWNFHKILINKQGNVEETYASFTKPTSNKIINKIEEIL